MLDVFPHIQNQYFSKRFYKYAIFSHVIYVDLEKESMVRLFFSLKFSNIYLIE